MADDSGNKVTRREFLGTTTGMAGLMIIRPELVHGTAANSALRVGCWVAGTGVQRTPPT
jgi:hypothetical protein